MADRTGVQAVILGKQRVGKQRLMITRLLNFAGAEIKITG
jgi:hypothetical protein